MWPTLFRLGFTIYLIEILSAIATILWLLIVGGNEPRWREPASLAAASIWR